MIYNWPSIPMVPSYLQLCILTFNCGSCGTTVFTIEKIPQTTVLRLFKPILFKGQTHTLIGFSS